jgi:hypothetical protein
VAVPAKSDDEIEYGRWHVFTGEDALNEERESLEFWPHWKGGIPHRLCRCVSFERPGRYHARYQSLELKWKGPLKLSYLKDNMYLLPGMSHREWSGVYCIGAPTATIARSCGNDPTGTLYVGCAGIGKGKGSTLRNRISEFIRGRHHKLSGVHLSEIARRKYPRDTLTVQWAYTDETQIAPNGKPMDGIAAKNAEGWLLDCYNDSFGELPPWNLRRT